MSVFVLQVSVAIPLAVIRGVADIQVRVYCDALLTTEMQNKNAKRVSLCKMRNSATLINTC